MCVCIYFIKFNLTFIYIICMHAFYISKYNIKLKRFINIFIIYNEYNLK